MLELKNGHNFNIATAAGALAYGNGWWWERYALIPLGIINPNLFTIITKSLTLYETKGNLKMWCPWRCVRLLPDGSAINAVGMTNIGFNKFYQDNKKYHIEKTKQPIILSLTPYSVQDAITMAFWADSLDIVGIELNLSCPNIDANEHRSKLDIIISMITRSRHPIGIKVEPHYPSYLDKQPEIIDYLSWITIGNTIKWSNLYPGEPSPLAKYGLEGGVSGNQLRPLTILAMKEWLSVHPNSKVMYCGGINSIETAVQAFEYGAKAVQLGTVFLNRPWRTSRIAHHVISNHL